MTNSLDQILEAPSDWSSIEPFELQISDVEDKMFIPVCLLGLFNPMGPTLVALNIVASEGKPSGAILCTTINPFAQSREVIMKTGSLPNHLDSAIAASYKSGQTPILGGDPTLVLLGDGVSELSGAIRGLLHGLLSCVAFPKELAEVNADYIKFRGDPWGRIPSMADILKKVASGDESPSQMQEVSDADFESWFDIMMDAQHARSEFGAIVQGWQGAISQVGSGMPHMALPEVVEELSFLGFELPKLSSGRKS